MQKQVIYIIQAHLLLAALAGSYLFLKTIPSDTATEHHLNFVDVTDTLHNVSPSASVERGKTVFLGKCASCHSITQRITGPALQGFEERGPWADRNKLYEWIKDPSSFLQKDKYTADLKKEYGSMMTAFPDMTAGEIDAIVDYINFRSRNTVMR